MKKFSRRFLSLLLSAAMLFSLSVHTALAAELPLPATVESCEYTSWPESVRLGFPDSSAQWLKKLTGVRVNDVPFTHQSLSISSSGSLWNVQSVTGAYGSYQALCITTKGVRFPAAVVISAEGCPDLTLEVTRSGSGPFSSYTAKITGSAVPEEPTYAVRTAAAANGSVTVSPAKAKAGEDVTVTARPAAGYVLKSLAVTRQSGGALDTRPTDGGCAFRMPAEDVTVTAVFAAEEPPAGLTPPEAVTAEYAYFGFPKRTVNLNFGGQPAAKRWLEAITAVTVSGRAFTKADDPFRTEDNQWLVDTVYGSYGSYPALRIVESFQSPATVVISAGGYPDLTLGLAKSGGGSSARYTAEITEAAGGGPAPDAKKAISLRQIRITDDGGSLPAYHWHFAFEGAPDYVSAITAVSVNGADWEKKSAAPSAGGGYYPDTAADRLVFSIDSFSATGTEPLKSGDVIRIAAAGYQDLEFKFMLDLSGRTPSAEENDGKGDHYALHIRLAGAFEAALVGQERYDGVSGATGTISSHKNSDVTVYGALVEKGKAPAESDWEKLGDPSSDIRLVGSKCAVSIAPDTAAGTLADRDSGMKGSYLTIGSGLTLSGTPKDAGSYLVSLTATDKQGRTTVSNALPFRIYTGEETLAGQLKPENLTQTQDGKYMWDIMEPWTIRSFGSNVDGEENSVRVPQELKAWFGSHASGTYGYLGYDLPWKDVLAGSIPQTLYIPRGCDLTLVNMSVLSSVRIVVEDGGKLTLRDSVVQGVIDVASGGTFSMNYSGFGGKGSFLTGASLCGQLRLQDGAVLENAAIYSHTNYLANGRLADRTSSEPVVTATGKVTVRGQVFIQGDEAANGSAAQAGLRVKDGTLTLEDGSVLVVYGGGAKVQLFPTSGTAIQLDHGAIAGAGKVVAVAGQAFWGNGGSAVSGTGAITAAQAFLQGATAFSANGASAGKAVDGDIPVTSSRRHIADGTVVPTLDPDPLEGLYWKRGIDPAPPLHAFETPEAVPVAAPSLSANRAALPGGGSVTLTVGNAMGHVSLRQSDDQGTPEKLLTAGADGTYSAVLPNKTAIYTFTVTAENGTATCTVSVTEVSPGIPYGGPQAADPGKSQGGGTAPAVTGSQSSSVIETIRGADGSVRTVERQKDGVVITTEIRPDGVQIRLVSRPGEDVTASVTLPQGLSAAVVKLPVDVGPGTVAKDGASGKIVSLPVPAENGLTVKVDKTSELVIADNARRFSDASGHWAKEAIAFCSAHEFFTGTGGDVFSPDSPMTRAMLVTVLARFDGQQTDGGSLWYEKAMEWAVRNGISDGSDPQGKVTREQLAAMLYRYAVYKGLDTEEDLAAAQGFTDYSDIAGYARQALSWAVKAEIIRGTGGNTVSPKADATRGQVAVMLLRLCKVMAV